MARESGFVIGSILKSGCKYGLMKVNNSTGLERTVLEPVPILEGICMGIGGGFDFGKGLVEGKEVKP